MPWANLRRRVASDAGHIRAAVLDLIYPQDCLACGTCIERCQVHAITQDTDGTAMISRERCIGCGLCVTTCPGKALELETVSKEDWFDLPASFEEWEERRLSRMGRTM